MIGSEIIAFHGSYSIYSNVDSIKIEELETYRIIQSFQIICLNFIIMYK